MNSQPTSPRGPTGGLDEADVPTLRREQRESEERIGMQMHDQFQRIAEMLQCLQQTALVDRVAPGPGRARSNTSRQLTDAEETGTVDDESQPEYGGDRRPPQRDTRRPGTFLASASRCRQPPRPSSRHRRCRCRRACWRPPRLLSRLSRRRSRHRRRT